MIIYDETKRPQEWYCQGKFGCIFFALVNSGMIDGCFSWMKPNEDFSKKSLEEQILFELKVITEWALLTGYYPFDHKETFHTLYSRLMKLVNEEKKKLDPKTYNSKLEFFKSNLSKVEGFFAQHEEKCLNNGTWDLGKHIRLETEKLGSMDNLPKYSLLLQGKSHWVVYLGVMDGKYVVAIDSKKPDNLASYPIEQLKGCTFARPKNIFVDHKRIKTLLQDFESNPKRMLQNLRRREYSKKMRDVLEKIDYINFTQKDYNRILKKAKNALESLDKEHYSYD